MAQIPHFNDTSRKVGLRRRLAAIFYDSLVIIACLMIITAVSTALGVNFGAPAYPLYAAFIFLAVFFYFAWCWVHGGQTIGMKAWKFRLISNRQSHISWLTTVSRSGSAMLSLAPVGLGFLWAVVDSEKLTWHDRLSNSRLVFTEED